MTVNWKQQRNRLILLTLVSFLSSCATQIYTPLITQYTYQVYTVRLLGNLSEGVEVSKQPCVTNASSSSSLAQQVQDQSADFLARLPLLTGGVSIGVNLFLGSYCDFLGRKVALLLPLLGHFLRNAIACVVIYWDMGLPGLYVSSGLDGLCGSFSGLLMGLFSYTADITRSGAQRTVGTTLIAGSTSLGIACFYILAGLLLQETGFFYPALLSSVLELFCVLLVLLLPETVPRDRKKLISPVKAAWRVVRTFVPPKERYKQAFLLLALLAFFINTLFSLGALPLQTLYLMGHPFCWSSLSQGIWGSASYASSQLAAFSLVKFLRNVVSAPLLVILGLLSDLGKNLVMGLSRTDLHVYMVLVAGICRGLVYPAMRSYMSSLVPRHRQGAMFAGIAIIESVSNCVGQIVMSSIYTLTFSLKPGFAFVVLANVQMLVVVIFLINYCLYRKYTRRHVISFNVQSTGTQTDNVYVAGKHTRAEAFAKHRHASI